MLEEVNQIHQEFRGVGRSHPEMEYFYSRRVPFENPSVLQVVRESLLVCVTFPLLTMR